MDIIDKIVALENEANEFGFSWENANQILTQAQSECDEIQTHLQDGQKEKLQEEIGDLLHAAFSLCVFCGFDPKTTLEICSNKFQTRLATVKKLALQEGLTTLTGKSFDELMDYWDKAKRN